MTMHDDQDLSELIWWQFLVDWPICLASLVLWVPPYNESPCIAMHTDEDCVTPEHAIVFYQVKRHGANTHSLPVVSAHVALGSLMNQNRDVYNTPEFNK